MKDLQRLSIYLFIYHLSITCLPFVCHLSIIYHLSIYHLTLLSINLTFSITIQVQEEKVHMNLSQVQLDLERVVTNSSEEGLEALGDRVKIP
jgi:hypothetical protein